MKKSELRQMIKEEVKTILKEENYAEKLAKTLVKTKLVDDSMSEKDIIGVIIKRAKKDIDPKTLKYWLMKDDDFLSDTLSNIHYYLMGR